MQSDFVERLEDAWMSLGSHRDRSPRIGIVLGSGLGDFAEKVRGKGIPFSSIRGFPVPSISGHSGRLILGGDLAVFAGRIHYYEGRTIDDVVFPIFLLHRLGARALIVTNAAGGINRAFSPGDLILIRDHINLMGVNPLRGSNPALGPRFPDMSAAYPARLRALAQQASDRPLLEGVYAALAGPSYETPAEIRMLAAIGADMVGMSTVPEVIAAGYLGMDVLGISCITNLAAGILDRPLDHVEVIERGREAAPRFSRLLENIVARMGGRLGDG
jgi:purine-nucleoside phosphorylase